MTFKLQNLFQEYRVETRTAVVYVNNFSTLLQRLVTVNTCVMYFVHNLKARGTEGKAHRQVTVTELKTAKMKWIQSAQDDLKQQDNFKQLASELSVKEDRGVGKLVNSDPEFDAQKPVILPRQHRLTRFITEQCHQRVHLYPFTAEPAKNSRPETALLFLNR